MNTVFETVTESGIKVKYKGTGTIIYQFECNKCGHDFEVRRSVRDNNGVSCPSCDSDDTFIRIDTCRFRLKGGGFPSKEIKIDAEIHKQDEIIAEGWRSQSEINEAGAMLKERDERLIKNGLKTHSANRKEKVGKEKLAEYVKKQRNMRK